MNKKVISALALPALALANTSVASNNGVKKGARPNIIYLMFDDAGYGDFGCFGQKKIETPNIDALSQIGIRFSDMYCVCPISAPSRCGLMTGRNAGHMQIRANENVVPERLEVLHWDIAPGMADSTKEGQYPLLAGTPTLATAMKSAGYKTAMIGKWGLGGPATDAAPNKMGFDYFFGFNCQMEAHFYYPPYLWENDKRVWLDNKYIYRDTPLDEGADPRDVRSYAKYTQNTYSPDIMFERLTNFVNDNANNPFFLMWTTTVPHSAVQAPLDEVLHYVDKLGDEEPIKGESYYPCRYPHATYAAMITHIDTQLGKLVAQLKRLGIWDNTVIIVTSDNGPANNSNSPLEYFHSGGAFKCGKGWGKSSLHEGGIRMPFIVAWGDKLKDTYQAHESALTGLPKGGSVTGYHGLFCDLMPTFCEMAGAKCPETDGVSFLPVLQGKEKQRHPYLYWEYPRAGGWAGVRWQQWKGFVKKVIKGNDEFELYDLSKDPREQHNVAAQHPEIVKAMWKMVNKEHTTPAEPLFDMKLPATVKPMP
ncbi:MAG: arylsulfatase [Bacteroidaceae bacterium]|nr:arylsulfatase [Bacteroidaceae bacterium]